MAQTFTYLTDSSGTIWQISVNPDGSLQQTVVGSIPTPVQSGITYTAQDIINGTSQDLRSQLPTNSTILLDYADRIHKQVLRSSRWPFLTSEPQQFVTTTGNTDYWIGPTGTGSAGTIETSLNLSDVYRIKDDTVLDRSNNTPIYRTDLQPPNLTTFEWPDGTSRLMRPTNFAHENYSNVLHIYPAPNNQNSFQPEPTSPYCTTIAGGALANRSYFVRYSIVDSAGLESDASPTATEIFVPAGQLLVVHSPNFPHSSAMGVQYNQYKVYAAKVLNSEVVQNGGAAINSGTNFTEPNTGIVTGTAAFPTANNLTTLYGYLIEFRYWKRRIAILSAGQALQVPDDYKDVLIAGVNWLGYMFLKLPTDAKMWFEVYQQGLREIIRDKNQFNDGDFLKPDAQTQQYPPGIIPGFITGN